MGLKKRTQKKIFIQDLDNFDGASSAADRKNTCNCSSPTSKNSRTNDQNEFVGQSNDSNSISLSNIKLECNEENQSYKFKSCVLAPSIGISSQNNKFENTDINNHEEKQEAYLQLAACCNEDLQTADKSNTSSRRESFSMTTAS